MKREPSPSREKSSAKDHALAVASPRILERIGILKAQLAAKNSSIDDLIELCAAAMVVAEELDAALKLEGKRRQNESGAGPILHAFAASAATDLNMLDSVEIALSELSPANPTLLSLKAVLVSVQRDTRSGNARKAAKARHHQGDDEAAKEIVKQCWRAWRATPDQYKYATQFAAAMLDKLPRGIKREPVTITRWVNAWDRAESSKMRA